MKYTKKAMAIIKEDIDYAYGSWIEGNQLSAKDYAEEQERLAVGILEDLGAVALYEALKDVWAYLAPKYHEPKVKILCDKVEEALAKAEVK